MILLLLRDGRIQEVYDCEDVITQPGYVICLDYRGEPITTFAAEQVLAYTLNPHAAKRIRELTQVEEWRVEIDPGLLEEWWSNSSRSGDAGRD